MAGGGDSLKVGEAQFLLAIVAKMGGSLTGKQWEEIASECGMRKGHTAFNKMKKDYLGTSTAKKSSSKSIPKKRKVSDEDDTDAEDDSAKRIKLVNGDVDGDFED